MINNLISHCIKKIRRWVLYKRILFSIKIELCYFYIDYVINSKQNAMRKFDDFLPRVFCSSILFRCSGLFWHGMALIKRGQARAYAALMKIIIEDSAVAYYHLKNKLNKLTDVDPTKCISILKNIIPPSGKRYGLVNLLSHFSAKGMSNDIKLKIKKGNKSKLIIRTSTPHIGTKIALLIDLYLIFHQFYCSILELSMTDASQQLKYWAKDQRGNLIDKLPKRILKKIENWIKLSKILEKQVLSE